jgi:hypothetical protein
MPLTNTEIAIVKGMLLRGDKQHDIAAYFGVNGARINEVNLHTREIGVGIDPTLEHQLPPPGPYLAGRSAIRARETLVALRDLIDGVLSDIDLYEDKLDRG